MRKSLPIGRQRAGGSEGQLRRRETGWGAALKRKRGPKHKVNSIRCEQVASLPRKDEACRESGGTITAQILPRLEMVTCSHGWSENARKEAWDNKRDPRTRSRTSGVRAAIVALKSGNAGGAKGRRKEKPLWK